VKVFPRLPRLAAEALALDLGKRSIAELQKRATAQHDEATFSPTGGTRVTTAELEKLRKAIVDLARRDGFPAAVADGKKQHFDAECAVLLHEQAGISASEASSMAIWSFLACILLPDVVRWRFPGTSSGSGTTEERFLGGSRGLRNTFGRLWWRAELLRDKDSTDEFAHVRALGEDELVQVTERPVIAGSRRVNVVICRAFREALKDKQIRRTDLLRDAMKRLRRLHPVVCLDALDDAALRDALRALMSDSATALRSVGRAS
jgi:hypothetical protein